MWLLCFQVWPVKLVLGYRCFHAEAPDVVAIWRSLSVLQLALFVVCREGLVRAAGGPELFVSMRATYTASLAAVSMAGYVAGIGDRHTDNFLVDLSSGALVPIDFGQATSHDLCTCSCAQFWIWTLLVMLPSTDCNELAYLCVCTHCPAIPLNKFYG